MAPVTFTPTTERPKVGGRDPKPNPYVPVIDALNADRGKTLQAVVPDAELKDVLNALDRAGAKANVTVRRAVHKDRPKKGEHTLTVWVIDKITKTRKGAEAAPAEGDALGSVEGDAPKAE